MPLGDSYTTLEQLKSYLQISDAVDDGEIEDALASASREIELHCNRQFNAAATATPRLYYPDSACLVKVDDFQTLAGLVVKVDTVGNGTFDTTWDSADYQVEPLNGIVDGQEGWPYNKVRAVANRAFPTCTRRASVEVTAQWGWAAVPDPVRQACQILASEIFKLRSAPFGVAGFGEYGVVRIRENPKVCKLLRPYERDPVLVG